MARWSTGYWSVLLLLFFSVSECAPQATQMIDARADRTGYGMGIDGRDFAAAAQALTEKLLNSGALDRPGDQPFYVTVGRIQNMTLQQFDTDSINVKVLAALRQSGKVRVTDFPTDGSAKDGLEMRLHDLRQSREVSQQQLSQPGQMRAPELRLTGKVIQNVSTTDSGQRVDYEFQLKLEDLRTYEVTWEDEHPITKLGTVRTVAW